MHHPSVHSLGGLADHTTNRRAHGLCDTIAYDLYAIYFLGSDELLYHAWTLFYKPRQGIKDLSGAPSDIYIMCLIV